MDETECVIPLNEETLLKTAQGLSLTFKRLVSLNTEDKKIEQIERILDLAIGTARTANISANHRTAACNLLCGTVEKCLSYSDGSLASQISFDVLLEEIHRLYFVYYHGAKEKSMKQILGILIKLLGRARTFSNSTQLLERSLKYTFEILFQDKDRAKAKPAFVALHQYMLRRLVLPNELLLLFHNWNMYAGLASAEIPISLVAQQFLRGVLEWITLGDVAASAAQLATYFLRALSEPHSGIKSIDTEFPMWTQPLVQCIALHPSYVQPIKTYVLPYLFKYEFEDLWGVLRSLRVAQHLGLEDSAEVPTKERILICEPETERLLLFLSLQVGIELGFVSIYGDSNGVRNIRLVNGILIVPNTVICHLLEQSSHEARLTGLKLLIKSPQTTKPYSRTMLMALGRSLTYLFEDSDASFRGEVQSLLHTFVNRLRAISVVEFRASLTRDNVKLGGDDASHHPELLELYKSFISKLLQFLTYELLPAASYQRRISALKTLGTFLKSGLDDNVRDADLSKQAKLEPEWPFHLTCVNSVLCRVLMDALMDPFEDVRQSSLECLKRVPMQMNRYSGGEWSGSVKDSPLTKARILMNRSGRVDHAEGFARLSVLTFYHELWHCSSHRSVRSALSFLEDVLSDIEEGVNLADEDLPTAVNRYPIHGHLLALRFIIDQRSETWFSTEHNAYDIKRFLDRQIRCLESIWQLVKYVLCNDAPEGFVPHELSASPEVTTKDLLSYAWRALKESSLLLRTMATQKFLNLLPDDSMTKYLYLQTIGNLCYEQLAELRHRGAFSMVAQTFAAVCRECSSTQDIEIQGLINHWYQQSLTLISSKSAVTTRRSAGIPALLVGIIASEPKFPSKDELIGELCKISTRTPPALLAQNLELPQVHALNSLAAIFSNSAIGEICDKYIVDVMEVASRCFGAKIWAIRNCGLILFRSLVDRLLGSNESLDGNSGSESSWASGLSYGAYPGLIELVQKLLSSTVRARAISLATSSEQEESTMPLEAVFAVVGLLRRAPPPSSDLTSIRQLILLVNNSPYWHVRDLAARAFATSLTRDKTSRTIRDLLLIQSTEQNKLHGRILCIRYAVCEMMQEVSVQFAGASRNLFTGVEDLSPVSLILSNCKTLLSAGKSPRVISECLKLINTLGHCILHACKLHFGNSDFYNLTELLKLALTELQLSTLKDPIVGREVKVLRCLCILIGVEVAEIGPAQMDENICIFSGLLSFKDSFCCQYVLRSLAMTLQNVQPRTLRLFVEGVASSLRSKNDMSILRDAEAVILEVCNDLSDSVLVSAKAVARYFSNLQVGKRLLQPLSPGEANHDILIWGYSLFQKWQCENYTSRDLINETESWIILVKLFLESNEDYSSRYAAIMSIRRFAPVFAVCNRVPNKLRLLVALAIYDGLNDDDEDLRSIAAQASSFLLEDRNALQDLSEFVVPLAAAKLILTNIIHQNREHSWIIEYGINRLIQHDPQTGCRPLSVLARLKEIERAETVLFVVEKQNLYIDEVRELKVWSTFLQSCSLRDALPQDFDRLTEWTISGLDTLTTLALQQKDGPFGCTTKPDTFLIGMRVIRSAETLLVWRTKSTKVPVQASTILTKLHRFYCAAQANNFHEMWLLAIAEVLTRSIAIRLKRLILAVNRAPIEIS